ncbi:CMRF35-like molecule 5 isoform X2 [Salminus brasiliensis]|uniref:CMRF35-like molecule 5 isoform X2 n=1 Tax=Salminus brasiliensis TaxID=930266 RepID=UPI003B82D78C
MTFISITTITIILLIPAGISAVTTITGHRGQSVQIKCSYKSGYETNIKYLCRGECPYLGNRDIPVQSGSAAKDRRFALKDDTAARVFTITITDLRTEDEGTYWCGVKRNGPDAYTEILLLVRTDLPESTTVSLFTFTPSPVRKPSTNLSPPASTGTIIPYVLVSLLVLGIPGIIVLICKRRKPRDVVISARPQTDVGAVEDRAHLKNDPHESQNPTPMTPVYESLNLNTNKSDSVYQTLNPKNIQSDSVYQCLYPKINQSNLLYQSSNPKTNINQSDLDYQSPNTNQLDSVYQIPNPNTNKLRSVYYS